MRRAIQRIGGGVLLTLCFGLASAAGAPAKRAFDVRDGIELSVVQPQRSAPIVVAPDGRRFFIVDSRGDLATAERVFTMSIYETDQARHHVRSAARGDLQPSDRVTLGTLSNFDAIAEARWVDDGAAIAFLGAIGKHAPQVYRYDLSRRELSRITDARLGVVAFDLRGVICTYLGELEDQAEDVPARGIHDESLLSLLFPDEADEFKRYATFVKHEADLRQLTPGARMPAAQQTAYFISPSGRYVAAVLAPEEIPDVWSRYSVPDAVEASATAFKEIAKQFQLIDLATGARLPLLDAPTGEIVLNRSQTQALWSEDERKLVLLNVMRPLTADLERGSETARSVPAVIALTLDAGRVKNTEIVPYFELSSAGESAVSIAWAGHDRLVIDSASGSQLSAIVAGQVGRHWTTQFRRVGTQWHRVARQSSDASGTARLGELSLTIAEDANSPPRLVASGRSGAMHVLRDFNHQLSAIALRPVESISWRDETGREWSGGLIRPEAATAGPVAVVLALKYFDPSKFRPDGPYTTAFASQALASRGMAVLEINAFDPATAGTAMEATTQLRGIDAALDHLKTRNVLDAERIGIIGFSRTSYYVAHALTRSRWKFAAATIADGLDGGYMQYQLFTLNHYHGAIGTEFGRMQGGAPFGAGLETWREQSAIFNLDKVHTPLRVEMIGRSSVLQEWELYASLRYMNKPVDAIFLPEGTHVLVKPAERLASQGGNVDWFDYWLQGNIDPVENKSSTYARWEKLQVLQRAGGVRQ